MQEPWPAPTADGPVDASVPLPGSKSVTARALVLAALADRPSAVHGPLRARDTELMAAGLRSLGVTVSDVGTDWQVNPAPPSGPASVDVGLSGTVSRFLPAVAALGTGPVTFDGDQRARERPLAPLVEALAQLGVRYRQPGENALPLVVEGQGRVVGGAATLDASASSQFVTGLLLAAPRFDKGVELRHVGPPVPSTPHLRMTVDMLRARGVEVDDTSDALWRVAPGLVQGLDVDVEPDLSNAAPFLAAALVTGGRVHVPGWPAETAQPGAELRDLLPVLGARVSLDGTGLTVRGGPAIHGVDVDLREVSELAPVLAVLAAFADGPTRLRGLAHVRGHETDRLAALASELNRLGGDVTETDDGLVIRPRPLTGGLVSTYQDHRMATAAALLGLAVPGVLVEDVATTRKTLPDFPGMWRAMVGSDL